MARKYDWGDGNGAIHSIPLPQHQANAGGHPTNAPPSAVHPAAPPAAHAPNAPSAPYQPGAGAPPQASPVAAAPGGGGGAPPVPDAQYLAEAAQRAFARTTATQQLDQQSTQALTARDEAIRRLLDNIGSDRANIDKGANSAGLLYSTVRANRGSDYEKAVQRAQADFTTDYQNGEDARAAARTAIAQGAPLEEAAALAAAAGRRISSDTGAADAGALAAAPIAAAAATPMQTAIGTLLQASNPGAHGQSGGSWQMRNGRRVWVPTRR